MGAYRLCIAQPAEQFNFPTSVKIRTVFRFTRRQNPDGFQQCDQLADGSLFHRELKNTPRLAFSFLRTYRKHIEP